MARKEMIIGIQDGDQSLTFKIRQMPATQLESWIYRAYGLMAGSGLETKADLLKAVRAVLDGEYLATLGLIDIDKAQPLLDELLSCCSRVVENIEERCTPQSVSYIQNVTTLFTLRRTAAKLNLESVLGELETA